MQERTGLSEREVEKWIIENKGLIHSVVRKYLGYGEYKDLRQEALIGALKGLRTWNPERNVLISTYVYTCMENELLMLVRRKKQQKRSGIEVSLDALYEDSTYTEEDILKNDPSYIGPCSEIPLLETDSFKELLSITNQSLTDKELKCLLLKLKGLSYSQIGREFNLSEPMICNIFKRIRFKIESRLNEAA